MRKKYISCIAVWVSVIFVFAAFAMAQKSDVPQASVSVEFFPLQVGNYWLYEGFRRWTPTGSKQFVQEPVTWKMEVVEVISREFITAAVIKGYPQEAARFEEDAKRADYLFLAIGKDRYYFLEGVRVAEIVARLKDEDDLLAKLVFEDELFLKVPQGSPFPQEEVAPPKEDNQSHAWIVAEEKDIATPDQVSPADPKFRKKFRLVFEALPSHTSVDFVPGIGITHYTYYHQGFVAEADLKLIEYFLG
jgi:hypothetical protein